MLSSLISFKQQERLPLSFAHLPIFFNNCNSRGAVFFRCCAISQHRLKERWRNYSRPLFLAAEERKRGEPKNLEVIKKRKVRKEKTEEYNARLKKSFNWRKTKYCKGNQAKKERRLMMRDRACIVRKVWGENVVEWGRQGVAGRSRESKGGGR